MKWGVLCQSCGFFCREMEGREKKTVGAIYGGRPPLGFDPPPPPRPLSPQQTGKKLLLFFLLWGDFFLAKRRTAGVPRNGSNVSYRPSYLFPPFQPTPFLLPYPQTILLRRPGLLCVGGQEILQEEPRRRGKGLT